MTRLLLSRLALARFAAAPLAAGPFAPVRLSHQLARRGRVAASLMLMLGASMQISVAGVAAQAPLMPALPELMPGATYDPAIPTLEQVVGHAPQQEITAPDEMVRYFEALAAAAPDRARLFSYGTTWEGRPLVMLAIGGPAQIAGLDNVKAGLQQLADPRVLSQADIDALIAELPVVVALVAGIHGNEISSGGAALGLAYHLLAATNDPVADAVRREGLVLIDPAQNPDGRARFVSTTRQARGIAPDGDPLSAEHDEPWPGGRVNHYLFDLNRDWFAQTQPETRGRNALLLEFAPHVVVDVHEMGGASTYYFPPNAVPGNPWTTPEQTASLQRLGAEMAMDMDARGIRYFNRDTYDAFYPGYGVSWPMALGAIGMTFEQASARGLMYERPDGSVLTYGEGVRNHFVTTRATVARSLEDRTQLLREFVAFRRGAAALGEGRSFVLHSSHDPSMAARLAETLARNGINIVAPTTDVSVAGRTLPATGTYIVPLDQPSHRLIRNLLDRNTPMDTTFVAEQIRRRSLRLNDQIYDVTAWSLPLLWDVEVLETRGLAASGTPVIAGAFEAEARAAAAAAAGSGAAGSGATGSGAAGDALTDEAVALLMRWGTGAAAATTQLVRDGLVVRATGEELVLNRRTWPVGTAIIRPSDNGAGTALKVAQAAAAHGAEVVAVASAFTDSGSSFGSRATRTLRLPRVALAWGGPGATYSTGWARHVLEGRYGLPVTAIRTSALMRTRLDRYDVIVLPSGNFAGDLSEADVGELRRWMSRGGTLITMAESARWAARVGLLATSTEWRGGAPEFGAGASDASAGGARAVPEQPIDPIASIAPRREPPEPVPGAILNVELDRSHWLASGTDGRIGALVDGSRIFSPITLDRGMNVGRYAGLDELIASGIVWEEGRAQLAHKAFLVHQPFGSGQLIAFAEDPNFRSYAEATQLLFVNAVLLGAGK